MTQIFLQIKLQKIESDIVSLNLYYGREIFCVVQDPLPGYFNTDNVTSAQ